MDQFRPENNGNRWNMEAVFLPEIFRTFSDDFRPEYCFHFQGFSVFSCRIR
jgi:hypothetical protein